MPARARPPTRHAKNAWRTAVTSALALFQPGDWLTFLAASVFCALSFPLAWNGAPAEKAVIRQNGRIFAELNLSRDRRIDVPGPLGFTAILVEKKRARVVSDPGMHQYCVRQGWLERTGEIAICAPNEVSLQIAGRKESYDSLSY